MAKSKRFRKSNPSTGSGPKKGKMPFGKNKNYRKPQNVKRLQDAAQPAKSKPTEPEVSNPFEIRINKRKHDVMGRLQKYEKGLPGVSRAKANEKRKETLLQEYKVRNKSGSLVDRRIGEKNKSMPEEDKLVRRAAVEKSRQYKKKSIFSLGDDDEVLTHRGKALINIDRYEDPRDMSDSEDELLSEAFVSDANFSGFLRMKKGDDEPEEEEGEEELDEEGKPIKKSRDQIIAEMILASKKRRFEKAKENDENFEKIQELDTEFKSVEFRNLLNELQLPKSTKKSSLLSTSDTMSTDELLAKIRGSSSNITEETTLGKSNKEKSLEKPVVVESSSAPGGEQKPRNKGVKEPSKDETDYDKLVRELQFETRKARPADLPKLGAQQVEDDREKLREALENTSDLKESLKEKLRDALEIVFLTKGGDKLKLPDVLSTLIGFFLEQVDYSLAANDDPDIDDNEDDEVEETKKKASGSKMSIFSNGFKAFCGIILPQIHSLLVGNSVGCTKRFLEHIIQAQEEFLKRRARPISAQSITLLQICPKLFPVEDNRHWVLSPAANFILQAINQAKLNTIQSAFRLLHLTCILYEFVCTSKRYCPEVINFLWSILLCFCPQTPNNTNLMVPNIRRIQHFFQSSASKSCLSSTENLDDIVTDDSDSSSNEKITKGQSALQNVPINVQHNFLSLALDILKKYTILYEYLPSSVEIFKPIQTTLVELLETFNGNKSFKTGDTKIKRKIEDLLEHISNLKGEKQFLRIAAARPKPLRLYEPQIDEDFDGTRRTRLPRRQQEEARLKHKVKNELKSAVREIKKDNSFLARQQLREQLHLDAERKRKVKDILGSLANQEGDYQKIKKGKLN